jgi:glycosyltransferase involved in cell wall biosynthesis
LEAYARYRPVIASAVGGIPEHLRDGETGILITANDIDRLAEAIAKLSEDYEATRFMGLQGRQMFLEEFTMDVHIQRLQKIYQLCIERFFN